MWGYASQSIEDYTYDAFNLVRGYRVRRARVPVDGKSTCSPDASLAPSDVWSYRFGPLQEREQKRQLSSGTDTTLARVYTLVGADGKQLASYNGLQGALCGRDGVRLWPVEFNTYGPNNTRIITRADGTSEVVVSDYLGSARVTLSTTAEPLQSSSYHPYGTERTSAGSGARTSYIGREHDNESDLGFYGVRLYEPEYGRFLSTDPLWGEFPQTATYVYADNEPITKKDPSGAIWETIWDVANVVVDGVRVAYHLVKGNKEEAKGAAVDLAADGLATLIPGLPAGLTKLRHADEVVDAAKTADKVVDASKAGKNGADGAEQVGKGRSANSLRPDASAKGAHTVVKKGPDGTVSNYATYSPNKNNPTGFQEVKRVDVKGKSHTNPDGTKVPTPHVKESGKKGVRPANKEELP